jgi:cadmium resistance protein CadD (predicted permease)
VARREPRADTAATAVVLFAVTNVDYIIVLSVLFARRDLRFHSLSHRGKRSNSARR